MLAARGAASARSSSRCHHQERVARAFDHDGSAFAEVELGARLFTISIDPQRALEEYLQIQVG